jgi:hypothetical protein
MNNKLQSIFYFSVASCIFLSINACKNSAATTSDKSSVEATDTTQTEVVAEPLPVMDTLDYKDRVAALAHDSIGGKWPVSDPVPLAGALLPFNRIVSYYGNFYSKHMGILGALAEDQLIDGLLNEVKAWNEADSLTPALPAIHYIAITAQSKPGKGNPHARKTNTSCH